MAIIKLSATERRRVSAFITCLVFAFAAWVVVSLSGNYKYTVKQVITFKNWPQQKAFRSLQSDTVDVGLTGTGWQMLFTSLKHRMEAITIDLRNLESKNYVVLADQLKQLNNSRDPGNQILSIDPDTLYFDFTNRIVKRVPVKLRSVIGFQPGFALSGPANIKPAFITISGPAGRVNNIKEWFTDSLKLSGLDNEYRARLKLNPVHDGNLAVYPKAVEIALPVDEFTEKTLEVPVKLINHNYDNIEIYPQKVKITFTVSLAKYAETNEDLFDAMVDLNLWREKDYTTLPVKITNQPLFSHIVAIEPRNIDFIVRK